jgi:peptidoglycan/xylan/chitin deacetylase (PgdA/CDA1 family)
MTKATFILSLDLELLWGHKPPHLQHLITTHAPQLRTHIHNLLTTLDHYHIPATWATVGHLFYDHCTPDTCLTTTNRTTHHYNPDGYHDPHTNLTTDPLYYGPDIIQTILDHHIHEIGYHSFSHPNFTDITPAMANQEIAAIHHIHNNWPTIHFKSFVYPYNAINHLDLLHHHGFTTYRSSTSHYTTTQHTLTRKLTGLKEKLTTPHTPPHYTHNLWELPATMYFCDPQLPQSIPYRATNALHYAITHHTTFHAWLHPWSLLLYPRLQHDLTTTLAHVATHIQQGDIQALTMGAYADQLHTQHPQQR